VLKWKYITVLIAWHFFRFGSIEQQEEILAERKGKVKEKRRQRKIRQDAIHHTSPRLCGLAGFGSESLHHDYDADSDSGRTTVYYYLESIDGDHGYDIPCFEAG
jgi:hypothetical protein